jgi:hypothetical protein
MAPRHPMVRAMDFVEIRTLEALAAQQGTATDDFQKAMLATCSVLFEGCVVSMPVSQLGNPEEVANIMEEMAGKGEEVPDSERLETADPATDDEEIVERMLALNWDLRGDDGKPLRVARHIALTIECAEKGVCGRLPDTVKIGTEH